MTTIVEMRCSESPGRLLAKMKLSGEPARHVLPDNLIELSCRDCTTRSRRADTSVVRVVHRFDVLGNFVESEVYRG